MSSINNILPSLNLSGVEPYQGPLAPGLYKQAQPGPWALSSTPFEPVAPLAPLPSLGEHPQASEMLFPEASKTVVGWIEGTKQGITNAFGLGKPSDDPWRGTTAGHVRDVATGVALAGKGIFDGLVHITDWRKPAAFLESIRTAPPLKLGEREGLGNATVGQAAQLLGDKVGAFGVSVQDGLWNGGVRAVNALNQAGQQINYAWNADRPVLAATLGSLDVAIPAASARAGLNLLRGLGAAEVAAGAEAVNVAETAPGVAKFPTTAQELFSLQALPYADVRVNGTNLVGVGNLLTNNVLGRLADQPFTLIPQFEKNPVVMPSTTGVVWGNLPSVPGLKSGRGPETFVYRPALPSVPEELSEVRTYSIYSPGNQPDLTRQTNLASALNTYPYSEELVPGISANQKLSYMINVMPDIEVIKGFGWDLKVASQARGREVSEGTTLLEILRNHPDVNIHGRLQPGIDVVPRAWGDVAIQTLDSTIPTNINDGLYTAIALSRLRAGVPVHLNHVDSPLAREVFGTKFGPTGELVADTPPKLALMGDMFTGDVPAYHGLPGYPKGPLPGVTGELLDLAQTLAIQKGQNWLMGITYDPQTWFRAKQFGTKYPFELINVETLPHAPQALREALSLTAEGLDALEASHLGVAKAMRAMSPEARGAAVQALNADDPHTALAQMPLKYIEQMPPGTFELAYRSDLRQPTLGQKISNAWNGVVNAFTGK